MNILRNTEFINLYFLHPTNMAEKEYCEIFKITYIPDFNILCKQFFFFHSKRKCLHKLQFCFCTTGLRSY